MNADMTPTGVTVHIRLDKLESSIFIKIVLECAEFLTFDGTIIVQLDKTLFGTVKAASLWYNGLIEVNWSCIVSYPTHMMIASSV